MTTHGLSNEQASRRLWELMGAVTDNEAVTNQTLSEESLKNGRAYAHRETFTRQTGGSLQILIHHPSSADDNLRVVQRIINPTKEFTGTLTPNVGITTAGTEFGALNKQIESPTDANPVSTVEYGGDYDKTQSSNQDVLPVDVYSTGAGANEVAADSSRAAFRMTPGTNILYDITSQADSNNIFAEFVVSEGV